MILHSHPTRRRRLPIIATRTPRHSHEGGIHFSSPREDRQTGPRLHHPGSSVRAMKTDTIPAPSANDPLGDVRRLIRLLLFGGALRKWVLPRLAGPLFIEDGIDGDIVPGRDAAAIAERSEGLLRDRALLDEMSDAARRKAATFSWRTYRQCLAATVSAELERARS